MKYIIPEVFIFDLIKVLSSEYLFNVLECLKENPGKNASFFAGKLEIHIITIQRILDTLEKYGFVKADEKKGIGRPSRIYFFIGGKLTIDLDELIAIYRLRMRKVRETGNPGISFSYDVDNEIVNAVLIGGKTGDKIRLDEKNGKLLWLVPPPDSAGENVENLARQSGLSITDAIRFVREMIDLKVIEETGDNL